MTDKIKLGISACLLGEKVRYDGGHELDRFLTGTLGKYVDFVPVCPEVECGLGVPREAMRLVGDPRDPRLVTVHSGVDHTERMLAWARRRVAELAKKNSAASSSRAIRLPAAWSGSKSTALPALPPGPGWACSPGSSWSTFPCCPWRKRAGSTTPPSGRTLSRPSSP